jgi:penicillin amidase
MHSLPRKQLGAMVRRLLGIGAQPGTTPAFTAAHLPALRGRLEVIRDRNGVTHIYADEEPDLYAALGFAQGADRFFFLDTIRRLGAGRLCALFGNIAAPRRTALLGGKRVADIDAFVRPFAFEAQSRTDLTRLSPRAAAVLDAFADGINAALRAMRGAYPPEYLFGAPLVPWHPADALLAGRACAFAISLAAFDNELTFDAVRGALGDDVARRMYPDAPWADAPTGYAVRGPVPDPELPLEMPIGGSNNWAVAGSHSAHGAPVVANDPHVPFLLPTFWYHAHLDCPAYRVQGGVLPGCPVFGFGHNGALAWGCTTGYRDGYDLYRVHRLPDDPARYRTVSGSGAITKHCEEVAGRRRPILIEWESCEHGVLFPGWRHHDGTDLAVRPIPSDLAHYFEGYLALAASQTVEAHREALALINDGPFDFNHVYGHRDGAIGWELFGRVPRRRRDGLFVRDAHDPDAQWDGWVPFAAMPKQLAPARGFVATANGMTDTAQPVAFTAVHCEPPYRTVQIEARLAAAMPHRPEDSAAVQRDVRADYAPALCAAIAADVGAIAGNDVAAAACALLRDWDGVSAADSAAALLFARLQADLPSRLFVPLLGTNLGMRYAAGRRALPRVHQLLLDPTDPLRADIARAAGRSVAALVRESFFAVVQQAAAQHGPDPAGWRWGAVQRIRLGTLLSLIPVLGRRFVALEGAFPGDEYTISPSRAVPFRGKLYSIVGATSRFICDLARPDEALFAHSAGPSADPASGFFSNCSAAWHRFEYFRSALWPADAVPDVVERVRIERPR